LKGLVWITGLSGCGKTTIAKEVVVLLRQTFSSIIHLDGDSFREIIGSEADHSQNGRLENAKRIARMCHFLIQQDVLVVCSTMSLYAEIHEFNRNQVKNYFEVYVECDFDELIKRDQKGLYSGAMNGTQKNVVGFDLDYDRPIKPDLLIDNSDFKNMNSNILKIVETVKYSITKSEEQIDGAK
jgi:adenylylsulfate kinase-like enzyme